MSEEDLEVLITLDDPGEDAQDEDNFNHFQTDNTVVSQDEFDVGSGRRVEPREDR